MEFLYWHYANAVSTKFLLLYYFVPIITQWSTAGTHAPYRKHGHGQHLVAKQQHARLDTHVVSMHMLLYNKEK